VDIRDFLRARWAEERADAIAAQKIDPTPWRAEATDDGPGPEFRPVQGGGVVIAADEIPLWDSEGSFLLCMTAPTARHVARWHPGHVLAELDAKERILAICNNMLAGSDRDAEVLADVTVREFASVYSAHPDYDPAWRVE